MKRVVFTIALCLVASVSFAQKKNVSKAQSLVRGSQPNIAEARTLIKSALENAETKDDPKTWYVAGYIEDQQYNTEYVKQTLGQTFDEKTMYDALLQVYPYFMKAYELDQLPNEKGKVKPKHTKNIKSILATDHLSYFNGGAYYFGVKDYQKAYQMFNQYLEIADHPMFKGEKTAERDSNYYTVQYYAAVVATQLGHETAIKALERAKNNNGNYENEIYQTLASEYEAVGDTVNFAKTLEEGVQKFPNEAYYLLNLINIYINTDRHTEAINYLNTAISKDPKNVQLYDVMGRVYEMMKDYNNAEVYFNKALEINPEYIESIANLGRIYYNQGVTQQGDANMIDDAKKYQEELAKAKELFKKALQYFEKAHKAKPDNRDYMTALRGIYYNLNMGAEFDAIEAEMNQ